jgi:hypothetical protein
VIIAGSFRAGNFTFPAGAGSGSIITSGRESVS